MTIFSHLHTKIFLFIQPNIRVTFFIVYSFTPKFINVYLSMQSNPAPTTELGLGAAYPSDPLSHRPWMLIIIIINHLLKPSAKNSALPISAVFGET